MEIIYTERLLQNILLIDPIINHVFKLIGKIRKFFKTLCINKYNTIYTSIKFY